MPPGPLEMWEKKNLLGHPYFGWPCKICDLFRLASFTENDTPAPGKKLFLDLRPKKVLVTWDFFIISILKDDSISKWWLQMRCNYNAIIPVIYLSPLHLCITRLNVSFVQMHWWRLSRCSVSQWGTSELDQMSKTSFTQLCLSIVLNRVSNERTLLFFWSAWQTLHLWYGVM